MKVNQISIFLENKSGRLSDVARILGENNINIRALSLADTTDFGILRLIVNDTEKADRLLKENGFTVGKTEVVAVEVEDRPGGLARILEILNKDDINVEYMYAFVERSRNNAVIIFRFDDKCTDRAIKLLNKSGIIVLEGKKIYNL
ncbi:ACT domain-containing protein [bacterium]|nr:ACT domain-containing protein [bacterium]